MSLRGYCRGAWSGQRGGRPWLLRSLRLQDTSGPLIMRIALGRPHQEVPGRGNGPSVGGREHRSRVRILRSQWLPRPGAANKKDTVSVESGLPDEGAALT